MTLSRELWVGLASAIFLVVLFEAFAVRPLNQQQRLARDCVRAYENAYTASDTAAVDTLRYYFGSRTLRGATCDKMRLQMNPSQIVRDSTQKMPSYFVRTAR
jgi:hypothetical protein